MEVLDGRTRVFLFVTCVLFPAILCGPQYGGGFGGVEVDQDTLNDIFGDSVRGGYGVEDEGGEWIDVPINLLPGEEGCSPIQQPSSEPQMQKLFEELNVIHVIKAEVNRKCDYYAETQGYECVPYYQCDVDGTIITDGAGLIDVRFGDDSSPELAVIDSTDLMCPSSLDVCCKNPDFTPEQRDNQGQQEQAEEPEPTQPPTPPPTQATAEEPRTAPPTVPTTTTTTTTTEAPAPIITWSCGTRNPNGLGVKVSGYSDDEAQFGEWPHICAVLKRELVTSGDDLAQQQEQQQQQKEPLVEEVLVFQAGASLIAPGVVVTAAHKVIDFKSDPGSLIVRCGEWDTQTEGEPLEHQDRSVTTIVTHPEFNSRNLGNTIGLLFVAEDFKLDHHINSICLPDFQETFDTSRDCYVKGWGKDVFGKEGQYQVVLKEVGLPMVTDDQCLTWLRATRLGRRFRLDPSFVCAGGEAGKDACRGDGGGPLVCPKKDDPSRYVQVGIVAWGIGCGEAEVPGVYTSVPEQVCWIDWVMKCHLGDSYQLQYGGECQAWLDAKQSHRVPVLRDIYNECVVRWPNTSPRDDYHQEQVDIVDVKDYGGKKTGTSLPEKIVTKTKTKSPQTKDPQGY